MCFSNLPVEFDEQGNPYLAEEAEDVDQPDRASTDDTPLDDDPEAAYDAIVSVVPDAVPQAADNSHGPNSSSDWEEARDDRADSRNDRAESGRDRPESGHDGNGTSPETDGDPASTRGD